MKLKPARLGIQQMQWYMWSKHNYFKYDEQNNKAQLLSSQTRVHENRNTRFMIDTCRRKTNIGAHAEEG